MILIYAVTSDNVSHVLQLTRFLLNSSILGFMDLYYGHYLMKTYVSVFAKIKYILQQMSKAVTI